MRSIRMAPVRLIMLASFLCTAASFVVPPSRQSSPVFSRCSLSTAAAADASAGEDCTLKRVPPEMESIPIPFVDMSAEGSLKFIECYADSTCTVDSIEYTIAVPCDYSVALCYMDQEQLIPIELADVLMDDIFPVAESIVSDEFGEELVLQRTPQTLTLVGELEEEEADEEDEDEDEDEEDQSDEEEVEVLLSFEHRGKEYQLVRLLDPILLVGKQSPTDTNMRVLLTPEESDVVMPVLEGLFLEKFNSDEFDDYANDSGITIGP